MSNRKYKVGAVIKSVKSLFDCGLVYKRIIKNQKQYWKIIPTAYINNMQFRRVMLDIKCERFRKAIKGE